MIFMLLSGSRTTKEGDGYVTAAKTSRLPSWDGIHNLDRYWKEDIPIEAIQRQLHDSQRKRESYLRKKEQIITWG